MKRAVALLALVAGCQADLDAPAGQLGLDEPYFRCRVQPVITKNCSQLLCHGDARRYFRVFARNRLRLGGGEEDRNVFMRDEERAHDLAAASAFVDLDAPDESLLLLKPLDQAAGGYYHGGATEFGMGDVFLATDEADYRTLHDWVHGATEDEGCIEPGSDM